MSLWFNPGRSSALNLRKNFCDFPPCPLYSSEGAGKSRRGKTSVCFRGDFNGMARRDLWDMDTDSAAVLGWNDLPQLESPQKAPATS